MRMDLHGLAKLQTEGVNPRTVNIDRISTLEMCSVINEDDHLVAESIVPCLPTIADAIDAMAMRARQGGRIVYVGAGTSGRSVKPELILTCERKVTNFRNSQARHFRRFGNPAYLCCSQISIYWFDCGWRCRYSTGSRGRRR